MQGILNHGNRLNRSFGDLESFVNQVFGTSAEAAGAFSPPADIVEMKSAYQICVELPGVKPEDVNVEFVDDRLQISGDKKASCADDSAATCHRSERRTGKFARSFQFNSDVDAEKIEASFEHGVLSILLPKAPEVLPRKIQIKAGS